MAIFYEARMHINLFFIESTLAKREHSARSLGALIALGMTLSSVSVGCSRPSSAEAETAPATTDDSAPASDATPPPSGARRAKCAPDDASCAATDGRPGGRVCGGFAGDTCAETEYCAYEAGQYCGAADASSTCQPRPEMCAEVFQPVCGCDNKTYPNACAAAMAGQGVLETGECKSAD